MTDAKPAGLPAKESTRPAYGSWAPGNYMCQCVGCRSIFIGDKRALHCADCAYALPDTKAALDTERAARLAAEARVKVLEGALSVPRVWTSAERDGMAAAFAEASKKHGHYESLFAAASWLLRHRAALKEPANG